MSLLNSLDPGYQEMITDLVDMSYNTLTMSAEGDLVNEIRDRFPKDLSGHYILVVEGTVPTRANGRFAVVGRRDGRPWTALQAVQSLGAAAKYVIAAGTCASFGGPLCRLAQPLRLKTRPGRPRPEGDQCTRLPHQPRLVHGHTEPPAPVRGTGIGPTQPPDHVLWRDYP